MSIPNSHQSDLYHTFTQLRFGELHIKRDEATGLLAIIAIHSTANGPALGGCRFRPYPTLEEGVIDALRLAQGMSYKAAIHQLPLGGGKAVIISPDISVPRTPLLKSFAEFVQSLNGRYITAEDSGTSVEDMDVINSVTAYVTGHSNQPLSHKDPSPISAFGVRRGIEAAVKFHLQRENCQGIHVAIQGTGHVGYHLAKELHQLGAILTVADIHPESLIRCQDEFGATLVSPEEIHKVPCDVFSPCALSNAVTTQNINEIKAKIIAGSANVQLESPELAQTLKEKGILYAPDYVINGGGLIYVAAPLIHQTEEEAIKKVSDIYETLMLIFEQAKKGKLSTLTVADKIARQRLAHS
ncbi:MAG: Leu/Phe/Val dehydrogenase [Candidatus Berkiellales bacterium]